MNTKLKANLLIVQEKKMISDERTCKKCGHRCHCYQPTCEECVNDVCTGCDCKETGYETLRGEN